MMGRELDGRNGQWSDAWFNRLVEQSLVGVYVVQDGRFAYVNPRLAELFGYSVDEVYRLDSVEALVAPPDRELVRENIRRRTAGEVESLRYSFRGQRRDGSCLEVEVHGSRIDAGGRPAVLGMLLDVTERNRAERERERLYREARQAVQGRDETMAIVSHDLRNPLNALVMAADLARARLQGEADPSTLELLARIPRLARRMNTLIEDLLDASALDAGRLSLRLGATDARDVARAAAEVLEPLAEDKGITLVVDVPSLPLRADHARLVQVLSNLGGNAIKFTPGGGRVCIRAEAAEDSVRFVVEDTGPGIPEAVRARIFDRYWKGGGDGEGLGLSIARGLVEAHGGSIQVESREGEGSAFRFMLPRSATAGAAA